MNSCSAGPTNFASRTSRAYSILRGCGGGGSTVGVLACERVPQGTGRRTRHPRADHQPFGYAERSMADNSVRLRSKMLQVCQDVALSALPLHRPRDWRASSTSQREMPRRSGAFHKCGNGMRIQAAQSFERQGRRPSALGHDGLWSWIFANRILTDRILAHRSRCRRRRLSARQIGSGGSA